MNHDTDRRCPIRRREQQTHLDAARHRLGVRVEVQSKKDGRTVGTVIDFAYEKLTAVHGAGTAQTSVLMDGMIINGLQGDGGIQSYLNDAGNEQMIYQTGGGTADSPTAGLKLNMVPKEGGNSLHGSFFGGFESNSLQSNNLSPFLASHGVRVVDKIGTYRDIDVTLGGPIKKDKLWFFGSGRLFTVNKPIANAFWIPQGNTYADCVNAVVACEQAIDTQTINSVLFRLTWQASQRTG